MGETNKMAEESKEPKTIYEQAQESALKHVQYNSVVQAIKQGKFVQNLNDIAVSAAQEGEEGITEEDAKILKKTDNVNMCFDYIDAGAKKFYTRSQNIFEKNLERIIDDSPQSTMEGIEGMIFNYFPNEKVEGEYKEVAKLHRQIVHMRQVLGEYSKLQDEGKKQDMRDDVMKHEIVEYYNSLYKDGKSEQLAKENSALLNASIKWISRHPGLCENKYKWLMKRKVEQFNSKLIGVSWKEYKAIKKQDEDEQLEWDRQTLSDLENEEDQYVRQEHIQKRNELRRREHLAEKISKKMPDYLKSAMGPEALMDMYQNQWYTEAQQEAQRRAQG